MGRALGFDLDVYLEGRKEALLMLRTALREPEFSALFQATEKYRGGADGQEKTLGLLRAMGSLLEDMLLTLAGTPSLIRNVDIAPELARMSEGVSVEWIESAARGLAQVETGMRRNLLRNLSIDAFVAEMTR